MTTATLVKVVRDPRSGESHLPREQVAIMSVRRNLDRTLLKVRWQAGGDCLVFPEDLDENLQDVVSDERRRSKPGISPTLRRHLNNCWAGPSRIDESQFTNGVSEAEPKPRMRTGVP